MSEPDLTPEQVQAMARAGVLGELSGALGLTPEWFAQWYASPVCPRCKRDFQTMRARLAHNCSPLWRTTSRPADIGAALADLRELMTQTDFPLDPDPPPATLPDGGRTAGEEPA